jgi:MFS family permease
MASTIGVGPTTDQPATMDRSLWRNRSFLTFWLAASISAVGTEITYLALPLTAVVLGATPIQMGLLRAAGYISDLLIGPLAGAWVDRVRRRPLLIAADLGRAGLLGLIPLAALVGVLRIDLLLVVALLVGAVGTLGKVGERSFLVEVVPQDRLLGANSALTASRSVAHIAGPGLGGALVQLLTAPVAVAIDAASFVLSALAIVCTRPSRELRPGPTGPRTSIWSEALVGLRLVWDTPPLRRIAIAAGAFVTFDSAFFGLYVLYVTDDLGVSAGPLGLIFMLGGVGGTAGAMLAGPIATRFGLGRAIVGGLLLAGLGDMLVPWVAQVPGLTVPLLGLAELIVTLGVSVFLVNELTLRQRVTPEQLQGRMHATFGVVIGGCTALGALGGGIVAEYIGVRALLLVAATSTIGGGLWLLSTSVWRLRT